MFAIHLGDERTRWPLSVRASSPSRQTPMCDKLFQLLDESKRCSARAANIHHRPTARIVWSGTNALIHVDRAIAAHRFRSAQLLVVALLTFVEAPAIRRAQVSSFYRSRKRYAFRRKSHAVVGGTVCYCDYAHIYCSLRCNATRINITTQTVVDLFSQCVFA